MRIILKFVVLLCLVLSLTDCALIIATDENKNKLELQEAKGKLNIEIAKINANSRITAAEISAGREKNA
jgi:hypothetical protein